MWTDYQREADADICFAGFDAELQALPGDYRAPHGALLVAEHDGVVVGAVGLRRLDDATAEMKRLYVEPSARRHKLGRVLVEALIGAARGAGYRSVRLDTLPKMEAARALYSSMGFGVIAPYHVPPVPMVFMEKLL